MRLSPFFTTPRPYKKAIATDPQRHIVYSLEREMIGTVIHTHCKREHLEAVIKHACRKYGISQPEFKIVYKKQRIFGWCYDNDGIWLNAAFHGDNLHTLLHELGHWITDKIHDKNLPDHSPEFVKIYAELLDAYKLIPLDAFRVVAKRWGLKIA